MLRTLGVVHCNASTQEVETRGSILSYAVFKVNLGYMRPFLGVRKGKVEKRG